jgi:prolyl-tRNA editing enzyme YbaK/EbsC (Cys-tRNA(Pro) deacylase)
MPIPSNIKKYLDSNSAKFQHLEHRVVYTAYDTANTLKKELHQVAKNLLIVADKAYIIAIVPASMRIDLKKLKKALKAKKLSIPNEQVMVKVFKVKPGAMTPFGGLHKAEVWVDKGLLKAKEIILNAGTFSDSVAMKAKDFVILEKAKLANFAQKGGYLTFEQAKKKSMKSNKKVAKKKPAKKKVIKKAKKNVAKKSKKRR